MRQWFGPLGYAALTTAVIAAPSFGMAGAEKTICDPKGKSANLNFTLKDMNGKDVAPRG